MVADTASDMPVSPAPEQLRELYQLMGGYRVSQAIYVVARLGIADLLKDSPRTSDDLAGATGAHAPALHRVLRFLAGVGLFSEVAPGRFALTPLGAGLRSDVSGSIRPMTLMLLDYTGWQPWGHLWHSVCTGETAFEHVHSQGRFDYLAAHPDTGALFNAAMTGNTAWSGTAITDAYDFAGIGRLVDVGGGHGLLLATVLRAHPNMQGVLFDRPEVVAGAGRTLADASVADRCELVGGDFFTDVLPSGDAHILRQIIHDWDDARATAILANCRRALGEGGRLLVIERRVAPDRRQALPVLHIDLEMLVNVGGQERTDDEYRALFAAAGFRLTDVVPLGDAAQFCVFVGVPV